MPCGESPERSAPKGHRREPHPRIEPAKINSMPAPIGSTRTSDRIDREAPSVTSNEIGILLERDLSDMALLDGRVPFVDTTASQLPRKGLAMTDNRASRRLPCMRAPSPIRRPVRAPRPIYQTTAFVFDDVDHAASLFGLQAFGNIYSRIGNPTCAVLEERVAALEGGTAALAVASGHAAEFITFHTLMQPGDELIAATKLYGGSINQFNHAYKNFGWTARFADPDDPCGLRGRAVAEDQGHLRRVDRQSRRRDRRYRGDLEDRQEGQCAAHRRQHDGDPLSVAPLRAWRRHRRAFGDQVPGRPRQLHRRRDRRRRQVQLARR